ncbi:hypothetical protein BELL_0602g00010 [Botrytis elliptica]|uniref:Uncharacterized protein n=1 Tax=Botrytis elliptica TaxID=278938 RepID=A0A4Z1JCB4_9HELO|nr:hypothetical protein EAE99_010956 [Botrytis elliptica]TGO71246.1 hypothetical protein BELL_0602g00010 [Botrytis elliptica]
MPPRFPPRIPREHINNLPPMTQDDLDAARKEFPEEKLPSRALEKYARKHWIEGRYFWKDNFRHVCGSDVQYFTATIPRYERKTSYDPKRIYHVAKNTPTLAMIDRPKKKGLQKLVAHQSEGGWALPRDHQRHLLNFPQEIIDAISGWVLTIEDHAITPDVTTSDWVQVFKSHKTYSLDGEQSLKSELSFNTVITHPRKDQEGTYFELRKVYRPKIDATLLRVCKSFRDNATKLLYKENVFHFTTMDWSAAGSPISWIDHENTRSRNVPEFEGITQRPLDEVPLLFTRVHVTGPFESFEPDSFAVNDAIRLIESSGTPVLEDCWGAYSYHDHFFRFLQAIGKEKAGMLKTLKFSGTVILHMCEFSGSAHAPNGLTKSLCSKDLVDTLRLYVPIINRFCTGLERLVIEVQKDPHQDWSLLLDLGSLDSAESVHQQYITSLLEGELRKLKTVKTLEVYELFEVEDAASAAEPLVDDPEPRKLMKRKKLDIAEPTIVWFRDRASKLGNGKGEE